jgi:hypothetical protein
MVYQTLCLKVLSVCLSQFLCGQELDTANLFTNVYTELSVFGLRISAKSAMITFRNSLHPRVRSSHTDPDGSFLNRIFHHSTTLSTTTLVI